MSLAYVPPGVQISEVVSPSFNPTLLDPTGVCIVGPARGFQNYVEVFVLDDNHPVSLSAQFVDPNSIVVLDATNATLSPFAASTSTEDHDFDIDTSALETTGVITLARAMQTAIADGEEVVVYLEKTSSPSQVDGITTRVTLDGITPAFPSGTTSVAQTITVSKAGVVPTGDYTFVSSVTPGATTLVWVNTAEVLGQYQTVYLDFLAGTDIFVDQPYQLDAATPIQLPDTITDLVVKNAPGADLTATAIVYDQGSTTDADYILVGTLQQTAIQRSAGSTTMGGSLDRLAVRVSYQATPREYWLPTRCFSQGDVEDKFGPAFDSAGNIVNPASFGASLAFANGVSSVIVQALFTEGTPRVAATGTVTDWEQTLSNLRDIEDITVIVPLLSTGGLAANDSQNLLILEKVQDHLNYMAVVQQHLLIALCGEDSTNGTLASKTVLRQHSAALGARNPAEGMSLVSPGAFVIANPITGTLTDVGGQYVAACLAGMLGRYPVQIPLSRKQVGVIAAVKDIRSVADKNADAAAGLCVVESKRGVVQVRHAITTATDTVPRRELNVVRGKYWMMQNVVQNINDQIIDQIILDANAAFQVQLVVASVLEQMQEQGAIVRYSGIQVRRDPILPDGMQVQFSYLPAFPLNRVSISFSIDQSSGVLFANTTLPQGQ